MKRWRVDQVRALGFSRQQAKLVVRAIARIPRETIYQRHLAGGTAPERALQLSKWGAKKKAVKTMVRDADVGPRKKLRKLAVAAGASSAEANIMLAKSADPAMQALAGVFTAGWSPEGLAVGRSRSSRRQFATMISNNSSPGPPKTDPWSCTASTGTPSQRSR